MRNLWNALALAAIAAPLFAGALTLEVSNPDSNFESMKNNSVALVRTTACVSPAKTRITATAEGTVNGRRRSIPLELVRLKDPGAFAVRRAWPSEGKWVIRVTATNPITTIAPRARSSPSAAYAPTPKGCAT